MAIESNEPAILSVTVRFRTRDGRERELNLDPQEHDAVFWSLEAVDRFLLPAYLGREGFEFIDRLRSEIVGSIDEVGISIPRHKRLCGIHLSLEDRIDPPFQPNPGS